MFHLVMPNSLYRLIKKNHNKNTIVIGDLAYRDDEGYYFISGKKNLLKLWKEI